MVRELSLHPSLVLLVPSRRAGARRGRGWRPKPWALPEEPKVTPSLSRSLPEDGGVTRLVGGVRDQHTCWCWSQPPKSDHRTDRGPWGCSDPARTPSKRGAEACLEELRQLWQTGWDMGIRLRGEIN